MPTTSPLSAVLALLVAAASLTACGGRQHVDDGADTGNCPSLSQNLGADALADAAACLLDAGGEPAAEQCRSASSFAGSVSPDTLTVLARCVLAAGERSDGAWLADVMGSVHRDRDRLAALAAAVGADEFDLARHANTFATALGNDAQAALGVLLGDLDEASRMRLVSIALGYRLEGLGAYAGTWVDGLDPTDPGVRAYAEDRAESGETLDETDRWALAASGAWSAADLIRCYNGDQPGCENWEGDSPLGLMAETDVEAGHPGAAQQAIRLLRSEHIDEDSVEGLAAFLGSGSYQNSHAMMNSMMLDLTAMSVPVDRRMAIARAATEYMCAFETAGTNLVRVPNADPDRLTDTGLPWPTFVAACLERHWQPDDMMAAVSTGSWLGVPPALYDEVHARLRASTDGQACADYLDLGQTAFALNLGVPMRGLAWTVAARLGGEMCASTFEDAVRGALADPEGHPESRLAATEWLLDRGDDSGCSRLAEIMRWRDEEVNEGPGPWAEAHHEALNSRCD